MRKPFIKAISIILLSSTVVVGLTGCKPDETQMKSAKQELQERGFTDPQWDENLGSFTVGVGTCRLPIRLGSDDWTIKVPTDSGISAEIRHANLTLLQQYPPIKACFGE